VSVIVLGDRAEALVERERDLQTAAARVESLRCSSGSAPMSDGLELAKGFLAEGSELYVFSDFQKQTWGGTGGHAGARGTAIGGLAAGHETFLIDAGGEAKFNYMLTDLRPEEALLSTGLPVRFRAVVEAWNPPKEGRATVTFIVDGVKKDVREVRPGEAAATVVFDHQFTHAGEHLVEAVLEGDVFRADNRRLYLCTVPESVQVLVLDETAKIAGNGTNGGASGEADLDCQSAYLLRALCPPTHPGAERVSRFSAKVVHPAQIDFENLEKYGAVVLAGAGALSETTAAKLEAYVQEGGALWAFLGTRVNVYEYNRLLFKDGKGLLPCRLVAMTQPPDRAKAPFIRFGDSLHPALAQLTGGGSEEARFEHFMELEPAGDATAVLKLSNGVAAVLEKKVGRGKVLLANFPTDLEWTALPATMEFPILVQELLRYLAGDPDAGVNLSVGDRFEQPVFVSMQHLLLRHPDGHKERLTPHKLSGTKEAWAVSFNSAREQGLYQFVDLPPEVLPRMRFIVNGKAEEGNLSRFGKDEFADAFGHGDWRWVGPEMPFEQVVTRRLQVTELASGVLWTLAAVLAIESLLALHFGRRRGGAA